MTAPRWVKILFLALVVGEPLWMSVPAALPEAEAQAWGMSRRTARRTSRRTTSRQNAYYGGGAYYGAPYLGVLPAGYRTVYIDDVRYYEVDDDRYVAKIIDGETVYVLVDD